jgi:HEXXH motif-containing protein
MTMSPSEHEPSEHRLSPAAFDELAAGRGGRAAVAELAAAEDSKHRLLLLGVLDAARQAGVDQEASARQAYDVLAAAHELNPQAAEAVIRYPAVGAWALRTVRRARGWDGLPGAVPEGLGAVAAAAAITAGLTAELKIRGTGPAIVLPSVGAAGLPGGGATIRTRDGGAEITGGGQRVTVPADPARDAPGWQGLRRITAEPLSAIVDDLDPFRMPAAPGLAARLSIADLDRWGKMFGDAWDLLARCHPRMAEEISLLARAVVPRSQPEQGMVSSTSPEAFGAIALSEPSEVLSLAETLVHETQHLKLGAILGIASLVRADDNRRFYAPWRDDPRPADGLLQGAYAYLGVAEFWRGQQDVDHGSTQRRAQAEFARWREATALVTRILLTSGVLTAEGMRFCAAMERTLSGWLDEPVPDAALALARGAADAHRAAWQDRNGPIPA